MPGRPKIEEQYRKDNDIINFVVYDSTTGNGEDEVLQHKLMGATETAHITLHPDGSINFREKRSRKYLENAVRNSLAGYTPALSSRVRKFIDKVRNKI